MLTYNRAQFLSDAIESVLKQTYQNWQLVIIDDGSTDTTAAVVANFNEPRMQYVRHANNAGIASRRVESLSYAEGTYTAILDSDDLWLSPEKLVRQVAFLSEHQSHAMVGTFITKLDSAGKPTGTGTYAVSDGDIRQHILAHNQFAHSSVLMRTKDAHTVGGYRPLPLAEDLDLFLRIGRIGQYANIPEYFTGYRIHRENTSAERLSMAKAIHHLVASYKDSYPNYARARLVSYARLLRARFLN